MEELQLLAGRQYYAGINRLVFHGVPYPYTRSDGKEWYPFPSGVGVGTKLSTIKAIKTSGANVRLYTMEEEREEEAPPPPRDSLNGSPNRMRPKYLRGQRSSAADIVLYGEASPWPTSRRASDRRMKAGPLPMSTHFDRAFLERLPPFTAALSRLTVAMSAGVPSCEVAWLRADAIYPDEPFVVTGRLVPYYAESNVTKAFRRRGLTYDRVKRKMLTDAKVRSETWSWGNATVAT